MPESIGRRLAIFFHKGSCIEFNEELLSESFPKSEFGDMDNRDAPEAGLKEILYRTYEIGKLRYMHFLQRDFFSAAYYTKATYWSHEKERRMTVSESEIRKLDDLILLYVPKKCITGLICGPRASEEALTLHKQHGKEWLTIR